jgi:hypothetical protein
MTLVEPGGAVPARCCSVVLDREFVTAIPTDTANRCDLLLMLPVDAGLAVDQLSVQVAGADGLVAALAGDVGPQSLEKHAYPPGQGPIAPDGSNITEGWVARVPVTLDPTRPWDIGGVRYPLNVTASYHVQGEAAPRSFFGRGLVEALVGPAVFEMGAAALPVPLACLAAFVVRWRRTR